MARYLFIVSRDAPTLHCYLAQRFAHDTKVAVILDRRVGPPEGGQALAIDRRSRPEVDLELELTSHVIVTVPDS